MTIEKKFKEASNFDKRITYLKRRKIPLTLTLVALVIFLFPPTYNTVCTSDGCQKVSFEFGLIFDLYLMRSIALPILTLELFTLFFLSSFWYLFEERNSRLNQISINHYSENIRLKKELATLKKQENT